MGFRRLPRNAPRKYTVIGNRAGKRGPMGRIAIYEGNLAADLRMRAHALEAVLAVDATDAGSWYGENRLGAGRLVENRPVQRPDRDRS